MTTELLARTVSVLRAIVAKEGYVKYSSEGGEDDGYRTVGNRTVRLLEDLNSYLEKRTRAELALSRLTEISQELGLYDTPLPKLPSF